MPPPSHPVNKRHDAPDSRHHAVKNAPHPVQGGEEDQPWGGTDAGCGCAPLRLERALYAAKALCKMSAAVEKRAMKIERSGYEPEIKTNLMVATVVTNPNIHYLLTCSPDRNDCELLLAGERYDFTPAPERVYPTGPNLATHGDGKRIVVLVQRTNTF